MPRYSIVGKPAVQGACEAMLDRRDERADEPGTWQETGLVDVLGFMKFDLFSDLRSSGTGHLANDEPARVSAANRALSLWWME